MNAEIFYRIVKHAKIVIVDVGINASFVSSAFEELLKVTISPMK